MRATLRTNGVQGRALGRACKASRKAWNWGLNRKEEVREARKSFPKEAVRAADAQRNLMHARQALLKGETAGTSVDDIGKLQKKLHDASDAAASASATAHAAGVDDDTIAKVPAIPYAKELHKELNKLKKVPVEAGGFPWMYESSKCAPQEALRDLDAAFESFFRRLKKGDPKPGYPKYKRFERGTGGFCVTGIIRVQDGKIQIPRIGTVRFTPGDRGYIPDGLYKEARITEDGERWCVSVKVQRPCAEADDTRPVVGIDAGVRRLATLSDGTVIPNPRALHKEAKRLRKAQQSVSRKQRAVDKRLGKRVKGQRRIESKRLQRARRVSARLAQRVENLRTDALHKATTMIAKNYSVAKVELLSTNMVRKRKGKGRAAKAGLNRAIYDSGMLRLRSLLKYKMPLHGGVCTDVDAPYTSWECSGCHEFTNPGKSEYFTCAHCALVIHRDDNASLNIKNKDAASCTASGVLQPPARKGSRGVVVRPKAKAGRHAAPIRQSDLNVIVQQCV